jgi:rhamnose utilization protein RhaD (predicted bifunctional aldolase and dehydrogenase)
MGGLTAESFVAMDRARIAELYAGTPPDDVNAREAWVKDMMAAAVRPDSAGRPSVEAPLHNSFDARFVLHTHPPVVNGMTCSVNGAEVCARLFPDALWMGYVNPGYTLAVEVRAAVETYAAQNGRQPGLVMIENHGIFVAGDSPDDIRTTYARVMGALEAEYAKAGVPTTLPIGPAPAPDAAARVQAAVVEAAGPGVIGMRVSGPFAVHDGPLTPDHIVYMKSYPLVSGAPTVEEVRAFMETWDYAPYVVSTPEGVYTFGESDTVAGLAMDLAQDGAVVAQLAAAFGGVQDMTDAARAFIENWEVESYRKQQIA